MKYRKKPIEVEAFCFGKDNMPEWAIEAMRQDRLFDCGRYAKIVTLEGTLFADRGDFIIKGVKGEIYPCKADIFYATYEESEDTE